MNAVIKVNRYRRAPTDSIYFQMWKVFAANEQLTIILCMHMYVKFYYVVRGSILGGITDLHADDTTLLSCTERKFYNAPAKSSWHTTSVSLNKWLTGIQHIHIYVLCVRIQYWKRGCSCLCVYRVCPKSSVSEYVVTQPHVATCFEFVVIALVGSHSLSTCGCSVAYE